MSQDLSTPPSIPPLRFDLDRSADGSSFERYRRNSAPTAEMSMPQGTAAEEFWIRAKLYQLPQALIYEVRAAGHTMQRGAEQIAQGGERVLMSALVSGTIDGESDGRPVHVGPGDIIFNDDTRGHHHTASDFHLLAILAARESVAPLFAWSEAHGAVLSASRASTRMLHSMMRELLDRMEGLTLAEADAATSAIFAMAEAALRPIVAGHHPYSANDPLIGKAVNYIDDHIGDEKLAPADLENHLAVSRSRLYRLFEPLGGVRAVILRRRLERAMRLLATGAGVRLSLHKLARDHGFAGDAQFARAFRHRFGTTPRAFQAMVREENQEAIAALAQRQGFSSLEAWLADLSQRPVPRRRPRATNRRKGDDAG